MLAMRDQRILDWIPPRASKPRIFTSARPWVGSSMKPHVQWGGPSQAREDEIPKLQSGK